MRVTAELTPSTPTTLAASQRTRIRTRLVAELQEATAMQELLRHDIADGIESRRGSTNDEVDDPEGANTAFESAQSAALLHQSRVRAREISEALARLDAGTYGDCSRCARPIAAGRLEARPSAAHCISCAA